MLAQLSLWLCLALHALGQPASIPSVDAHLRHLSGQSFHEKSGVVSPSPASGDLPCLSGIINDYTPVLGFGCDSSTLQVGPVAGFSAGDKVLLLQMQVPQVDLSNTAGFGTPLSTTCIGNYEFNRIKSISGGSVQLQFALMRSYDISGKIQLVRVPEYDSASICSVTCLPWNGSTGGVFALDVKGLLTFSGDIDVSGKGFRGGNVEQNVIPWVFGETQYTYPPQPTLSSAKGEGMVMIPTAYSFGRGHAANGGGGGNAHNAGGGGGGNAGAGGDGGLEIVNLPAPPVLNTNGIGGGKYFENDVNKILLGGGAGAGHANDGRGSSGGTGGGIAIVLANTVQSNNFRVVANGVDVFGGFDQNDGQGGGGAGGTVVLKIGQLNGNLPCELRGGRGGSNPYNQLQQLHGPGGGGSGGKLLLTQSTPGIIPSLQGGLNGVTSQNFSNGAAPGEVGKILAGFALPEGTQPVHPVSNQMVLAVQSLSCSTLPNGKISVLQSTALAFRLNAGSWQSDSVFTGLTAGNYLIGLQFSGGCTLDTMVVLTASPPLRDTLLAIAKPTCTTTGSLTIGGVAGTAPFEFQINNGGWQPSGNFANLSAGTYTIVVRDAAGCTQSGMYALLPPVPLLDSLVVLTNATCAVGGTISLIPTAGNAPFEFQINNGPWQPTGNFSNLPPGPYTVILRDAAGCTYSTSHIITMSPPVLDSLVSLVPAGCTVGGRIVVTAISGTAPFQFQINNGPWQPTGNFANLAPGSYNITVRDAAQCTHTTTYVVGMTPPAADSLVSLANAGCLVGGQIVVAAVSGTAPFEFQRNGGAWQPMGTFSDLPPGNYIVTVRDAVGCTAANTYTIAAAPPASVTVMDLANATCVSGGTIVVGADSGTAPFEFQVDGGPWQANGFFPDLSIGLHTVVLRDSVGCTHTSLYSIAPPGPVLDSLVSLTEAGCTFGGSIVLAATSGVVPFEFQINGGAWQLNGNFTDLPPDSYTVTVRDAAGCTSSRTQVVAAPPPVQDSLLVLINAGCTVGGGLVVTAVSGTPPFEYQLDNGPWQSGGVFLNLPAGPHTVALRDGVGCTHSSIYTIAPPPPVRDSLLTIVPAGCTFGGGLAVTAVSGTAPFAYQLDGGPWQYGGVFWDLSAGAHTVTIRDTVGCTVTDTYVIEPPLPVRDSLAVLMEASCTTPGGLVAVSASGQEPFEFQLDNGPWQSSGVFWDLPAGSYVVTLRDAAGCTDSSTYIVAAPDAPLDSLVLLVHPSCISPGGFVVAAVAGREPFTFQLNDGPPQASGVFWNLPPGPYTITLRDDAGCTHVSNYVIESPPPLRDSLLSLTNAGCAFAGSLSVAAVSGTLPFEFQLDNGPWQSNGTFADLTPGMYTITLRDGFGCTRTSTHIIHPPPPALDSLAGLTNAGCTFGGTITATAISGTAPFEFQLDSGPWQSDGSFTDLPPGSYTVTLRDSAGCVSGSTHVIAPPPPALDSLISYENSNCTFGGQITVAAISGTAPFEFQINSGAWQPDGVFTDLPPGNYTVTLRDAAGCTDTTTFAVAASLPVLDSLVTIIEPGCTFGGQITVAAISGTAPFEFQLNNGPWQPGGAFTSLLPGSYAMTTRDAVGCTHTSTYVLEEPPAVLDSLLVLQHAGCTFGGQITVGAISGTAPFEFQLNNGLWQPTGAFTDLSPGTYTVALRDAVGCTHTSTYSVLPPPPAMDSLLAITDPGCRKNGSLRVAAVSGTPPFQFQLNGEPWQPTGVFANLPSGDYVVTLLDGVGCVDTSTYTIAPYEPLAIQLDSLVHIDCRNSISLLAVSATGGSGAYTYQLDDGSLPQSEGDFFDLPADLYSVTVTDATGCTAELSDLEVLDFIDTALTRETVTIYEGAYFELPDGRRIGRTGQYFLNLETTKGCDSLHIIDVIVLPRHVYVPNIFHPNDDGDNDYLSVFSDASLAVVRRFSVYDRWGELVFEKRDMLPNQESAGWDGEFRGRLVNAGVFIWVAELEFVDGWKRTISGDVTVIR